jgi:hypothetical protein
VPRFIFDSDLEGAQEYIQIAIAESNIMHIFGGIIRLIFSDQYSSSLVMPIVDEDLQLTSVAFVSQYALENTCISHKETI